MTRPRHPVKELEAVLRESENLGWRVTRDKRYFKLWCPNPCKCRKTVHLTPSGARYEENLRHYLRRYTCWDFGQEVRPERSSGARIDFRGGGCRLGTPAS